MSDQQNEVIEQMVSVPYDALHQVLSALNGPPYFIAELQATRSLDDTRDPAEKKNPINRLIKAHDDYVVEYNKTIEQTNGDTNA